MKKWIIKRTIKQTFLVAADSEHEARLYVDDEFPAPDEEEKIIDYCEEINKCL